MPRRDDYWTIVDADAKRPGASGGLFHLLDVDRRPIGSLAIHEFRAERGMISIPRRVLFGRVDRDRFVRRRSTLDVA